LLMLLLVGMVMLGGCGLLGGGAEVEAPVAIRTAKPTFTPTAAAANPAAPVATPAAPSAAGVPAPAAGAPPPAASGGPKAVVNSPLVNARTGPGTEFDIVATVERGAEYDIVGVSPDRAWWEVCCVDGEQAWINADFVDTDGPVDSVAAAGDAEPSASAGSPAASAPAATPIPTAPAADFVLEAQEQFPETSLVRIFLYVYSGNSALEGYALRVTKDGVEMPTSGVSFGGQPAFTWPFQDPRQRYQNYKVEFPDTPVAGVWQVQIVDNAGNVVGPPAAFNLAANDPRQELYVRYVRP
jgi:hypothetical protein